jgi:hypothetical protein
MVIINCRICKKYIDMPSKSFKMCSECKHQKQKDSCKRYKKNNKEHVSEYNKKYKAEHKEETTIYNCIYNSTRREIDENFRIRTDMRSMLHKAVFENMDLPVIGCSNKNLRLWIESNFNSKISWLNYASEWQIDHVIPLQIFDLTNKVELNISFNWKNIRPLCIIKNQSKKFTLYDVLLHELKTVIFAKNNKDKFNNIPYGIYNLPNNSRNRFMELVNR